MTLMCLTALACDPPADPGADRDRYAHAVALAEDNPTAAVAACQALSDTWLKADCTTAAVRHLARTDPTAAADACGALDPGVGRDECGFVLAERSGDMNRCADAGRFADDCMMHRWGDHLQTALDPDDEPGAAFTWLGAEARAWGFAPDDPRPWIAGARAILGARTPLDLGPCDGLGAAFAARACREAGLGLFHDRLNHARDTVGFPCEGGPLPPRLRYAPDADLDAALAARRAKDLCP